MTDDFEATVCWFHDRPLVAGDRLKLKHTTRVTPAIVESIEGIFDVNELEVNDATELEENDIGDRAHPHRHAAGPRRLRGRPDHRELRAD